MEGCSVTRIMSLRDLAIHPTNLLRVLPKRLALNKFRKDPSLMETLVPELPQDILMDIFALLEIPDLMRAGSVCSSWRSAYTSLRSLHGQYKRPQTPCLLYTSESAGDNVACLYSLAEKRVYKLTLPDPPIRNRHLIGSSHGWLVTADERSELHLVNPITGEQIALPSVITIEQVKPIFDDAGGTIHKFELWRPYYIHSELIGHEPSVYDVDILRDRLYIKAFVFPDPSTASYIVVLIHQPELQLSFARAGDRKWALLSPGWDYQDCVYMDGLLYALTRTGGIEAFDLTGPTTTRKIIIDGMKTSVSGHMYIVQAPSGDVLQAWRAEDDIHVGDEEVIKETNEILLYKVNMTAKELVKINGLHDHVLFLGQSQSQCLSAEEYPQLKANRVYFTDDELYMPFLSKNARRDIGVFNLENDIREETVFQLWCSWPNPIWITPNLTTMNMGSTDGTNRYLLNMGLRDCTNRYLFHNYVASFWEAVTNYLVGWC